MVNQRVLLCILDGWGIRDFLAPHNPLNNAVFWKELLSYQPYAALEASGHYVGLPDGQMGNSEVGHTTIGSGRVILQDLPRLNKMFQTKEIFELPKVTSFLKGDPIHLLGLFSKGGVHSHADHIQSTLEVLRYKKIILHLLLDGRDTQPQACLPLLYKLKKFQHVQIATLSGRYYAMDRDQRLERTKQASDAILFKKSKVCFSDPVHYIQNCYAKGLTDEFIPPAVFDKYDGVSSNSHLWTMNFRSDRMRQILYNIQGHFSSVLTMTHYGDEFNHPYVLSKDQRGQTLGQFLSNNKIAQLRLAETEKYPHVTYFFNRGRESPYPLEDRIMIPSPKVATYDLDPAMSSQSITKNLIEALRTKKHRFIVANYASPDMVGHTGNFEASLKAVKVIDHFLKKIYQSSNDLGWTMIITSDHGNIECMKDEFGAPHTSHTCSPVPFVTNILNRTLRSYGTLADIAPTVLDILGYKKPASMTGESLLGRP